MPPAPSWTGTDREGPQPWTRGLIERIEGGAYTFAGEGEPFVGILTEGRENPYATGIAR